MAVRLCDICGLARKSSRSRSRSRRKDYEQRRPPKSTSRPGSQNSRQVNGRGKRPGVPCWMCGGPHYQRECPDHRISSQRRGHRGDQELSRTEPSTLELLADQAMQGQRQGTTQVKNKDIATWRRSFVETTAWPHAVLGRDQLPVRVSHCVQRCGIQPWRTSTAGKR